MSKTEKSVFETLNSINVNDKVEKKNGLTYLSWAWAWAEVKKNYPSATYKVVKDEATNMPFVFDSNNCHVFCLAICLPIHHPIRGAGTTSSWAPCSHAQSKPGPQPI